VAKRPDGAMLPRHLSRRYPNHLGPYLERMRTEGIAAVADEAFEVVEEDEASTSPSKSFITTAESLES
jgi:hypothetical protein